MDMGDIDHYLFTMSLTFSKHSGTANTIPFRCTDDTFEELLMQEEQVLSNSSDVAVGRLWASWAVRSRFLMTLAKLCQKWKIKSEPCKLKDLLNLCCNAAGAGQLHRTYDVEA